VGTMAPIDIVQAEAEVARNEEAAIVAASQIDLFEDQLRALIFDPKQPEFWTMDLDLTEPPQLPSAQDVDIEAAVQNALQKRKDLVQSRKSLEASQINLRFYNDQLKPLLNAVADYGLSGLAGVQVTERGPSTDPNNPFAPGPVLATTSRRFSGALS